MSIEHIYSTLLEIIDSVALLVAIYLLFNVDYKCNDDIANSKESLLKRYIGVFKCKTLVVKLIDKPTPLVIIILGFLVIIRMSIS